MTDTTAPYKVLIGTGRTGSGKTSGASFDAGRTRGKVHLWDTETERTACGRAKGAGYTRTERAPKELAITCSVCRSR